MNSAANPVQAAYQTTYSYDSAGDLIAADRPATTAAPNGATTSFTYDTAGNMVTSTDPRRHHDIHLQTNRKTCHSQLFRLARSPRSAFL